MLSGRRLLLAVTGGIAAYKACELLRLLIKNRASVRVAMSDAATRFISPLSFEALSGSRVEVDLFSVGGSAGGHLALVRDADMMVVAPATANCLAKLANGIADDLISTAALALSSPLLVCPAMNPRMYAHPAVQDNLKRLKKRGVLVLDPEEGPMAGPDEELGLGRLPEPERILDRICRELPPEGPLSGKTIIVTAGPTREPIDPVRVISNLSSGRMGFELAVEARKRGARVHLISGPVSLPDLPGVDVLRVDSTKQMLTAVKDHYDAAQAVIMAAAPADFRSAGLRKSKLKKEEIGDSLALKVRKTTDILKELSRSKGDRLLVGFALETDDGLKNAGRKLQEKNLDLIVLNHPAPADNAGLGRESVQGTLLHRDGRTDKHPVMTKTQFAGVLLDEVVNLLRK